MALTLADIWNIKTDGRAVIIGHGGAIRATAGLVGRGACVINGRRVLAASYSTTDAGWETNPDCYTMPDALKTINGKAVWTAAGGTWLGHDISNPSKFRASSLFQKFEAEALLAVLEAAPIGEDDTTDLVFVNMKGPDYTGHAYGPYSPEIKETLSELDRQVTKLLELLDRKAGAGRSVVVVTADHGMPPEPPPGGRYYLDDVRNAITSHFDPQEKTLIQSYDDASNNQIYVDPARLKALGLTLKDMAAFLEKQPPFTAVFTEDEVRAAQARLSPVFRAGTGATPPRKEPPPAAK
jgi:predicted AlkP superfamily pyrophosphatase or phosphodiesterase